MKGKVKKFYLAHLVHDQQPKLDKELSSFTQRKAPPNPYNLHTFTVIRNSRIAHMDWKGWERRTLWLVEKRREPFSWIFSMWISSFWLLFNPFLTDHIYPFPPNSGRPIEMEMAKFSTNQRKKKKLFEKLHFEAWKHPCYTFMIRWMFAEASMGPWL